MPGIEYLVFDPDSIEHFLQAIVEYIDGRFEEPHSVIEGETVWEIWNGYPPARLRSSRKVNGGVGVLLDHESTRSAWRGRRYRCPGQLAVEFRVDL